MIFQSLRLKLREQSRGNHPHSMTERAVLNVVKRASKRAGLGEEVSTHWLRHAHVLKDRRGDIPQMDRNGGQLLFSWDLPNGQKVADNSDRNFRPAGQVIDPKLEFETNVIPSKFRIH